MSQPFDLELGFEDDAPGFDGAAAAPGAAPRRTDGHPVDSVHVRLSSAELLARFRIHRPRWFKGLEAESNGIDSLLADEAALSARWGGLPGTDHRSRWDHGADTSRPTGQDSQAEWQPPLWLMTPLVRRSGGTMRLKLPAALSPAELEQALVAHCPPAWRRERVRVRLEIETRIYWGARAPNDLAPWRICSERGDGVGLAEPLLEVDCGKVRWLVAQQDATAPTVRRSLRPGVGLLVAVPLIIYERLPRPITPVGRLVQRVLDWFGRTAGTTPRRDRDPTFIDRLRPDEAYWAAALGGKPPGWLTLHQAQRSGMRLAPASAPAVRAAAAAEPEDVPQIVLLHGGLSSARGGFDAWLAADAPRPGEPLWPGMPQLDRLPVWRFEHDTFLPLDTNIAQLVEALERQVVRLRPHGRLVLLAHSRGGAVARFALPALRDRWPGWDFHALTAGAPHAGTDVFERLGQRWVGLAGAVGLVGLALRDAASRDLLAKLKNLERGMAGDIPPGFQDLLPHNLAERASGQPWPAQLVTWGSHWRADVAADWSARGWRHLIEDFGGFEADGDGMIPLDSAKHGPLAYDASPVFHTEYFAHPATRQQIDTELQRVLTS